MAVLPKVARQIRAAGLTRLAPAQLATLLRAVRRVDVGSTPGIIVECGVGLGGTAVQLATSMRAGRAFHGYDVFGSFSPPGGGQEADLYAWVSASLERFGVPVDGERVQLHPGPFADTLQLDGPVAVAHIDAEFCEPVRLCLDRIWPQLPTGGLIVVDGYNEFDECRDAVEGFVAATARVSAYSRMPSAVLEKY
jgi:O-methyltransferase